MHQFILFQSTHPRGVRLVGAAAMGFLPPVSIHAPAWGATAAPWQQPPAKTGFNPRTRVGCDHRLDSTKGRKDHVSIHAPAWGATPLSHQSCRNTESFNPRTRVGCDALWPGRPRRAQAGFNPRTRVGCDVAIGHHHVHGAGFNPRTRVGCDLTTANQEAKSAAVSIHAPAWGATCPGRAL